MALQCSTFEIKIDDKIEKTGSLLEDMTPPINPAHEIDDPNDKKPADWVDEAKINDPEASKPDDWDEVLLAPRIQNPPFCLQRLHARI